MKASRITSLLTLLITASAIAAFCLPAIRTNADNRVKISSVKNEVSPVSELKRFVVKAPIATEDDDKGFWLTIRPTGFEIKEMTISAGDYFVVVHNATGLNQFSLRVERETGERIYDVRLPRFRKYWKQMVHLIPGRYLISEIDHPEWNCVITVD
jgi:hypothetical protein